MTFSASINNTYRIVHQEILAQVERATDEQFTFRPVLSVHSMAFNLWHLARWADHLQSRLPDMTPELEMQLGEHLEIWMRDGLAALWGFPAAQLGHDQTGMLMDDAVAGALPLPEKATLLGYARQAFAAAEETVGLVGEDQYNETNRNNRNETIVDIILSHILHEGRHLGEMEYLLGLQGEKGSATR